MKKVIYLLPAISLFASCSPTPSEADALRKLNRVVNPTEKSLFKYANLKITKKTESVNNNVHYFIIDYLAVREANKDIVAKKNVMEKFEYIDTSISDYSLDDRKLFNSVKKGDIIDTLYASMTLIKSDNGWK